MSDRESASIEAQIVKTLRPDIGIVAARAVAREVIDHAIGNYGVADPYRLDRVEPPRRTKGRPKQINRLNLAVHVGVILRRAGVKLSKTRDGKFKGAKFQKVLTVVFEAVGETVPRDILNVLQDARLDVEFREFGRLTAEIFKLS